MVNIKNIEAIKMITRNIGKGIKFNTVINTVILSEDEEYEHSDYAINIIYNNAYKIPEYKELADKIGTWWLNELRKNKYYRDDEDNDSIQIFKYIFNERLTASHNQLEFLQTKISDIDKNLNIFYKKYAIYIGDRKRKFAIKDITDWHYYSEYLNYIIAKPTEGISIADNILEIIKTYSDSIQWNTLAKNESYNIKLLYEEYAENFSPYIRYMWGNPTFINFLQNDMLESSKFFDILKKEKSINWSDLSKNPGIFEEDLRPDQIHNFSEIIETLPLFADGKAILERSQSKPNEEDKQSGNSNKSSPILSNIASIFESTVTIYNGEKMKTQKMKDLFIERLNTIFNHFQNIDNFDEVYDTTEFSLVMKNGQEVDIDDKFNKKKPQYDFFSHQLAKHNYIKNIHTGFVIDTFDNPQNKPIIYKCVQLSEEYIEDEIDKFVHKYYKMYKPLIIFKAQASENGETYTFYLFLHKNHIIYISLCGTDWSYNNSEEDEFYITLEIYYAKIIDSCTYVNDLELKSHLIWHCMFDFDNKIQDLQPRNLINQYTRDDISNIIAKYYTPPPPKSSATASAKKVSSVPKSSPDKSSPKASAKVSSVPKSSPKASPDKLSPKSSPKSSPILVKQTSPDKLSPKLSSQSSAILVKQTSPDTSSPKLSATASAKVSSVPKPSLDKSSPKASHNKSSPLQTAAKSR
jgi:hypothetical protein